MMFSRNGSTETSFRGSTASAGSTPTLAQSSSSSSSKCRILVMGDSGVGKSLLLSLLEATSRGQRQLSTAAEGYVGGGTIGVNVESIVWRDPHQPGRTQVIDFLELSGNRSFSLTTRKAFYDLKSVSGVILVHDVQKPSTASALTDWVAELKQCGIDVHYFLIGAVLEAEDAALASKDLAPSVPKSFAVSSSETRHGESSGKGRKVMESTARWVRYLGRRLQRLASTLEDRMPPSFMLGWVTLQYAVLVAMAFVLFGWTYTVSSSFQPKPPRKVLEELQESQQCFGVIERCPFYDPEEFQEHRAELDMFLAAVGVSSSGSAYSGGTSAHGVFANR